MKTVLSDNNPFQCSRYAYVFEQLPENGKCLDYGCYDGSFIAQVKTVKTTLDYIGLDKNSEIINLNPYQQNIQLLEDTFPIEKATLDAITILDVLEHVHKQNDLLKQFHTLLQHNGVLIITVPKQYLLSFLDLGNFKFRFPRLHKFYYSMRYSQQEYRTRYLNNPNGLIGDIEKEKAWHQHFTKKELEVLLHNNGFEVISTDGSGYFARIFILLNILKLGFLIPKKLYKYDCIKFSSMNLFCVARKCKT